EQHRLVRDTEDLRKLLVAGRDPDLRVDHENNEVCIGDRALCLVAIFRVRSSLPAMSTPPVSISRKRLPDHSQTSSLRSRVVPLVSCTTAARELVSRLTSVDLPTFGNPTIATVPISWSLIPAGSRRAGGRARGRRRAS